MPNEVKHNFDVFGKPSDIQAFRSRCFRDIKDVGLRFDFNVLIPIPAIVEPIETTESVSHAYFALTGKKMDYYDPTIDDDFKKCSSREEFLEQLEKKNPGVTAAAQLCIQAEEQTGSTDSLNWRCKNWGTKSVGYFLSFSQEGDHHIAFTFYTAWRVPEPIFAVLAQEFPNLEFRFASWQEFNEFGAEGRIADGKFEIEYFDVEVFNPELEDDLDNP